MDRVPLKILGGVAAKTGENPVRRRGQGSTATFIRRGLVEPKRVLNRNSRMDTRSIFRDPQVKASSRKPTARGSGHMPAYLTPVAPGSTVMVRTGGMGRGTSQGVFFQCGWPVKSRGRQLWIVPRTDTGAPG
jgi:hypothetical protein